jgi:hypothetical protein
MNLTIKIINLFLTISFLLFTGCKKENQVEPSELEQTGLLGTWEIREVSVNGIADLAVDCCDFLEFSDDDIRGDFQGVFKSYGAWHETNGTFLVNTDNHTILFDFNNNQKLYDYEVQDEVLSFSYIDEGQEITEDWIKQE